jgi:hypothetical protein
MKLRQAVERGTPAEFHKEFCRHLRKPARRLRNLIGDNQLLALWSVDLLELNGRERELAASIEDMLSRAVTAEKPTKLKTKQKTSSAGRKTHNAAIPDVSDLLRQWVQDSELPAGPWESLAVSEMILRWGHLCDPGILIDCLGRLCGALTEATARPNGAAENRNHLVQAVSPEYVSAWQLSLLLTPVSSVTASRKIAAAEISRCLMQCTDDEGMVHGSFTKCLDSWLIPLVCSAVWAHVFQEQLWGKKADARFAACLSRFSLWLTSEGVSALSPAAATPQQQTPPDLGVLLQLGLKVSSAKGRRKIEKLVQRSVEGSNAERRAAFLSKSAPRRKEKKSETASCWQSDQSCMAIMRSSLNLHADLLLLEWHSADLQIALSAGGTGIINGTWDWQIQINETIIEGPGTWACTCWFLDHEAAFVELELQGIRDCRVIRQALLLRDEHTIILTDSIKATAPDAVIRYRSSLDLQPTVVADPDAVTRETLLRSDGLKIRSFPVWLDDDRVLSAPGTARCVDGQLQLTAEGRGGVTVPLVLDWHPQRSKTPADWTRLTVAENRRNVSSGEAAGFRLRTGKRQWLIYRSLAQPAVSRTVLGMHSRDETVYGRVLSDGVIEHMLLVESEKGDILLYEGTSVD